MIGWARKVAAEMWLMKDHFVTASRPGVRILIFHHVRTVELSNFTRLIDHLLDRDEVIGPEDLARSVAFDSTKYILSFDDGYESNHGLARDVLNPRKIRALFFVCPGLIGQEDPLPLIDRYMFPGIYVPAEIKRELHFMSWDQVVDLQSAGHMIGSHAMFHQRLSQVEDEGALYDEVVRSGEVLAERLHRPVTWFAYPFGDLASIDARALDLIRRHYDYCCSGIRGFNSAAEHKRALFREYVDLEASFAYQLMSARGGLDLACAGMRRGLGRMLSSSAARVRPDDSRRVS